MKLVYPIILYPSGVPGGYTVLCPDMPGLVIEYMG
ncbi:phage protein [Bifidobacterium callitrichos DSM 23973]|uniref:Phage protein n=1 Tax=Bifidobacterium callitrichos DSM 23973 TaxID=1437609 RepID=A0A087A9K3_9BIFI|nr:phage protein [Bifidobacterium callitrichos DSM 23973]